MYYIDNWFNKIHKKIVLYCYEVDYKNDEKYLS